MDISSVLGFFKNIGMSGMVVKSASVAGFVGIPIGLGVGLGGEGKSTESPVVISEPSIALSNSETESVQAESSEQKKEEEEETFRSYLSKTLHLRLLDEKIEYGWKEIVKANKYSRERLTVRGLKDKCGKMYTEKLKDLSDSKKKEYELYAKSYCSMPRKVKDKLVQNGIYWHVLKRTPFKLNVASNIHFWHQVRDLVGRDYSTDMEALYKYCKIFPETYTSYGSFTEEEKSFIKFCNPYPR